MGGGKSEHTSPRKYFLVFRAISMTPFLRATAMMVSAVWGDRAASALLAPWEPCNSIVVSEIAMLSTSSGCHSMKPQQCVS